MRPSRCERRVHDDRMTAVHNRFGPGALPRLAHARRDEKCDLCQGLDRMPEAAIIVRQ